MDAVNQVMLRGICALYFENHVAPVLRSVQEFQDKLKAEMQDLRSAMDRKANSEDLPDLDQLRERARCMQQSTSGGDAGGVGTRVKLQNLEAALRKKADSADVPTMAYLHKVVSGLEQRTASKETALAAQVSELGEALAARGDAKQNGCSEERMTRDKVNDICAEMLQERVARLEAAATSGKAGDTKKMQVIIAAAASRFDKQLKEVTRDVHALRKQVLADQHHNHLAEQHHGNLAERWPGRNLQQGSRAPSEVGSVAPSDVCSAAPSLAPSTTGLSPEDQAELRRIQAVVGAAGTAFSRELRELRGGMRDLRAEVLALKQGAVATPRLSLSTPR
mmetsp:Transcript_59364/g.164235  ORF Transcript_59364/g.164235 Transcript_59364/m.164235 type:complete len:335 (+) Transcript_59364:74-1078(+)